MKIRYKNCTYRVESLPPKEQVLMQSEIDKAKAKQTKKSVEKTSEFVKDDTKKKKKY